MILIWVLKKQYYIREIFIVITVKVLEVTNKFVHPVGEVELK